MGGGPDVEEEIFYYRLLMLTHFSVELANSARFISEIAGFLHVVCIKNYPAINNT